jgi:hypothetical protein
MINTRKSGGALCFAGLLCAGANAWAGFYVEDTPHAQLPTAPSIAPVVASRAAISPIGPMIATCEFAIQQSDETVENALKRWAASAGWQPPQWNYRTVYSDYLSEFCGDGGFEGAVDRLMAAENAAGIPLFATFHTNRVVVIDGGK